MDKIEQPSNRIVSMFRYLEQLEKYQKSLLDILRNRDITFHQYKDMINASQKAYMEFLKDNKVPLSDNNINELDR